MEIADELATSTGKTITKDWVVIDVMAGSAVLTIKIRRPSDVVAAAVAGGDDSPDFSAMTFNVSALAVRLNVTVTNSTAPRLKNREVEVETKCPPGKWCSAGKNISCPINTYNERGDANDQASCVPCPPNSETAADSAASFFDCVCKVGYYSDSGLVPELTRLLDAARPTAVTSEASRYLNENASSFCRMCMIGTTCTEPGLTTETLVLAPGNWRIAPESTDVRRCPDGHKENATSCVGTEAEEAGGLLGCHNDTTGVYCRKCKDDAFYFSKSGSVCLPCQGSASVATVVGVPIIIVCLFALCAGTAAFIKRQRARASRAAARSRR